MRKTSITSQSSPSVVSLSATIANVATPYARITVPRGATYRLHNRNEVRGVRMNGTYVILDLRTGAGDKISGASRVLFFTRGPADEFPKFHRAIPYSVWRDLSTTDQRNEDFKATIISQTDLNTDLGLEIPEGHQLLIQVEGPDVVDTTKSFFQVDFEELN
ncbi:hypothetical protein GO986_21820 [Deinococcus sp. HMF7620]|uniref:Uncharacterized protein n=1 Tax=Deinococcus arboris TaxID=2682977 RepID=A0A7C9LQ77_9DEIO|nr:hypothetical protein [Deinococcus arboris]MVN89377.1 hypothetical protein [Deinococcus arboris]